MQSGRVLAIISLIAPLTLPTVSTAQGSSGIQLFTSYDNSFPGGAGMGGFGLTLGAGSIGVRGNFSLTLSTLSSSADGMTPPNSGRWSGDADLLLADNFLGLGNLFGGAVHPYGFAGIGAHSASASPTIDAAVRTWSYGGGVALPLSPSISIDGEMRNRTQLGSSLVSSTDFVSGTEFRVGISLRLGSSGSSRSGAASSRTGSAGGTIWSTSGVSAAGAARRVVPDAERYIGVPYVYGGSTPKGFDCSGLVQYVYRQEGVDLPRTSRQMAGSGYAIDPSPRAMAVGDLMLFAQDGTVSHVALYAGGGRFIHSSSSGNGVRYDDLSSQRGRWFADHLVKVRRVATGSAASAAVKAFAKSVVPFDHFDPPDLAPPPVTR
jgi:cell wall-associated NlpC family hydrolase